MSNGIVTTARTKNWKMSKSDHYLVKIEPAGGSFTSLPGRSLLHSGLAAGRSLPYGCANGSCGECRARVIAGSTQRLQHADYPLTETEKINGVCLLCSTAAGSDLTIEVVEANSPDNIPLQQLKAKLARVEQLQDVSIMEFKFTRGGALRFLPGQDALLDLPDGTRSQWPIASCPCNASLLELHVPSQAAECDARNTAAGSLLSLHGRDRLSVTAPTGSFTLKSGSEAGLPTHHIFITEGLGFARAQGMLEHLFNLENEDRATLLWLATPQCGHYRHNLCRSWDDAYDNFSYLAVPENSDFSANGEISASEGISVLREHLNAIDNTEAEHIKRQFYLIDTSDAVALEIQKLGIGQDRINRIEHATNQTAG